MKKEDLKVGQKLWVHNIYGRERDYEVVITKIAKKYLYVSSEYGFREDKFSLETFMNYDPSYSSNKKLYLNKEKREKEEMVRSYRIELRDKLLNYLNDDEIIELYKKIKNGISNNNNVQE